MLISAVFDTANIVMNGRIASIGSPVVVSASPAPMPNAATSEPRPIDQSQNRVQARETIFPRYSIETARKMSPSSTSTSGT